jgi:hypothetical protein
LSVRHGVRHAALVSERHVRRAAGPGVCGQLHVMHTRSVLRVSGSVVSYGPMQVGLLLRRRQSCGDAALQRRVFRLSVPRELCGRDVSVCEEHDVERCLSAGPLLPCGQSVAGGLSTGHELDVYGSAVVVSMSVVRSGLLLSERGHGIRVSQMPRRLFLSSRHCGPREHHGVGMPSRVVMSDRQQAAHRSKGVVFWRSGRYSE